MSVIDPVTTTARRGRLRRPLARSLDCVLEGVELIGGILVRLMQHDRRELRRRRSRDPRSTGSRGSAPRSGASSATMPCASLSARTPITKVHSSKSKYSVSASRSADAPCGLCAASTSTVGSMPMSWRRPGRRDASEPLDHDILSERAGAVAQERFDRGDRHRGVLRLVVAVQRQVDALVPACTPADVEQLAADGDGRRFDGEVALARRRRSPRTARRPPSARRAPRWTASR